MTIPVNKATSGLAGKLSYSFLLRTTDTVIGMGASIVAARIMGPEVLGMFSSALAISMLIGLLANRGLGAAHLKIASTSENRGECMASMFAIKGLFIVLCAGALAVHLFFTPLSDDRLYFQVLMVCSAVIVVEQCNFTIIATFNACIDTRKGETPLFVGHTIRNLCKIAAAVLGFGALALGYAELAGTVVMSAILLVLFRSYSLSRPKWAIIKRYMWLSVPFMFIQLSRGVAHNLDKSMIKYFYETGLGNIEVGLYSAGQRLGTIIQTLTIVAALILFPAFSRLAAQGNFDRIKSIIMNYENMAICLFLPLAAALAAFSLPVTLVLIGEEYRASASIMQISIAGLFVMMLYQPYVNFLIGAKDLVKLTCMLFALYIIVNVVLNILFIPERVCGIDMLGLRGLGAAIASSIAYLVLGLQTKLVTSKFLRIPTFSNYWSEIVFLLFLYVCFTYGMNRLQLESFLVAIVGGPAFLLLFWGFLFVFRRDHLREAAMNLAKIHPRFAFIGRRVGK